MFSNLIRYPYKTCKCFLIILPQGRHLCRVWHTWPRPLHWGRGRRRGRRACTPRSSRRSPFSVPATNLHTFFRNKKSISGAATKGCGNQAHENSSWPACLLNRDLGPLAQLINMMTIVVGPYTPHSFIHSHVTVQECVSDLFWNDLDSDQHVAMSLIKQKDVGLQYYNPILIR